MYEKHSINSIGASNSIEFKEVKIEEFAVMITISPYSRAFDEPNDESSRQVHYLRDVTDGSIKMDQLIDKKNRVSFVCGAAGMGKSVLAKRLACGWANGDMYQEFKFCIMFECRELNYFKILKDVQGTHLTRDKLVCNFLEETFCCHLGDGEGILFIVDGLSDLYDINDDSIIGQLLDLDRTAYKKSEIILLGRPHIDSVLQRYERIGGLRQLEIVGLDDDQIKLFINAYPFKNSLSVMDKVKDSLDKYRSILRVPQFLNTFCCVAILTNGEVIQNPVELYCWTLYLLLTEHTVSTDDLELTPNVFRRYSDSLLALSSICYELLTKNTTIFEGNILERFRNITVGRHFALSLFIVSDCSTERYQFAHSSN